MKYIYSRYKNRFFRFKCKLFHKLFPNTIRHTVQITSIGGVGTTFLYEFAQDVGLNIYNPCDRGESRFDYGIWKHKRKPINNFDDKKIRLRSDYKVVYIIGNPYNAIISIFRRNYQLYALDRLELPNEIKSKFHSDWNLDDYLNNNEDIYMIEEHVHNWTNKNINKDYEILVMKYEKIWDNKEILLDFMEVPKNKWHLFPTKKERSTNFDKLNQKQKDLIMKLYGNLNEYIDSLPDYFII